MHTITAATGGLAALAGWSGATHAKSCSRLLAACGHPPVVVPACGRAKAASVTHWQATGIERSGVSSGAAAARTQAAAVRSDACGGWLLLPRCLTAR